MPTSHPSVSVIICNYNMGIFLTDCIKSIAEQDYPNFQIAFVDDCSTDESWNVVKSLLLNDLDGNSSVETENQLIGCVAGEKVGETLDVFDRYRAIKLLGFRLNENRGPSAARNLAIKALWETTDIFIIADADDFMLPGKISRFVEVLESDKNIGLVYADYLIRSTENGSIVHEIKEPFSYDRLMQECIVHSQFGVKKSVLEKCGLYPEDMNTCEDWHLEIRAANHCLFYHVPEPLTLVNVGNHGSTSYRSKDEWVRNWKKVADLVRSKNVPHSARTQR